MTLRPAPADAGVVFRRVDFERGADLIRAEADAVTQTRLGTTLENAHGAHVMTVEHLMAALAGMGVDNIIVEMDGPEVPAMDGSSRDFVCAIAKAGVVDTPGERRIIRVLEPVEVRDGDKWARFEPCERWELDITIDFDDAAIGRQRYAAPVTPEAFAADVAEARTFAFLHEVEAMRAAGLARGGSVDNCVVVDDGEVVNLGGLRRQDEFVRHKWLDALGDLFVAGRAFEGRYVAHKTGHALNNAALRALLETPGAAVFLPPRARRLSPIGVNAQVRAFA